MIDQSLILTPKINEYNIFKNIAITGDAPKDIISLYTYKKKSKIRRNRKNTWPTYIAKLGHKYYPIESITEHLFTRIGESFKFNMADSCLAEFNGQLRFLSKYFLKSREKQKLTHGAELYASYLSDNEFVEAVEKKGQAADIFTVQVTREVLKKIFPNKYKILFNKFLNLLLFDAILGNNDRHFYNWEIVQNVQNDENDCFSPTYDSARGLLWHETEEKLQTMLNDKLRSAQYIKKYAKKSKAKIGIDGIRISDHFKLIEKICVIYPENSYKEYLLTKSLEKAIKVMNTEFYGLLSSARREMIERLLRFRFETLQNILSL